MEELRVLAGGGRVHPSAIVDEPSSVGRGTTIWHFAHVMTGARIGEACMIGQGVFIASTVTLGNRVRVQNHVSLYDGVTVEDDVFVGPSAVFTNVKNPRAALPRRGSWVPTRLGRGCTIGANATIVCGVDIGAASFVAAGAVVTSDVIAHALVAGVPARQVGWVGARGLRLRGLMLRCPESGALHRVVDGRLVLADGGPRDE